MTNTNNLRKNILLHKDSKEAYTKLLSETDTLIR